MNSMKRKINNIPDFKHTPEAPVKNEVKSIDQTAIDVLSVVRRLEPEDQNEVVKLVLKELAIDRVNTMKSNRDASIRAEKNAEMFLVVTREVEAVAKEAHGR